MCITIECKCPGIGSMVGHTYTPIGRANDSEKSRGSGYTDLASMQSHSIPFQKQRKSQPSLTEM